LKDLNEDLVKNIKTFQHKNLENLLKILDKKQVNIALLSESKIGKSLTRLIEHKESAPLKETAQTLVDKWRQIAKDEKMSKLKPVELPHIPDDVKTSLDDLVADAEEPIYENFFSLIIKTL
jgi:tRNA isopentenyl-2-thiomethyl-A-37 hydroxylase MiaE